MSSYDPVALVCSMEIGSYVLLGLIFARTFAQSLKNSDKLAVVWYVFNLCIHTFLEGRFVYYTLNGTVLNQTGIDSAIWKEYSNADKRWGVYDSGVLSVELGVVLFCIPLCILALIGTLKKKAWRHYVQIVLCAIEIYGGWATFAPEWLTGSPNLDTESFIHTYVYLFFFNFLWVIVPGILLYQSYNEYMKAFKLYSVIAVNAVEKSPRKRKVSTSPTPPSTRSMSPTRSTGRSPSKRTRKTTVD